MSIIRKEQLSNPLSASYALTASYAENAGVSINTGSLVTTSSFNAFTASINNFTSSYNTGSFSGSFTGSLSGTASLATSASYALNGGVTQLLAGPNISLSPSIGLGQVTISSIGGGGFNTSTGSYGSFYDTTTQTNLVGNVPRSMSLNTTDISNGVSISGSTNPYNTYIKTENAGIYNIQFSAQLDKTDSGTDEIVIWLRKNGIDLIDTATTISLVGNNAKNVAAWNWFVNSAANDYYQIIWYSPDVDLKLLAEVAGGGHPGIPSVIVTVNRVDQFLSNTGSFTGSFTGAFTGSLFGTASWAQNTLTASYVTPLIQDVQITGSLLLSGSSFIVSSSQFEMLNNIIINSTTRRLNSGSTLSVDWGTRILHTNGNALSVDWQNRYLYGTEGFISVYYGNRLLHDGANAGSIDWNNRTLITSNGIEALNWSDDVVNYSNTYHYRLYGTTQQDNFTTTFRYSGEIIEATAHPSITQYNLVALSGSIWFPVNQTTDISTRMLGIALTDKEDNSILLEGDISWDGSSGPNISGLTPNDNGKPIYIRNSATSGEMSNNSPGGGYVRIVGYVYYNNGTGYILKFKPSNDWYKLS